VGVEGIERVAIVRIQRPSEPDTLWQVGIRQEMPPEGNQVGTPILYDFLSRSGFEAPGCDDCPLEDLSEPCRRNRILMLRDDYVSSYLRLDDVQTRLDDVQIGQTEPIQFLRDTSRSRARPSVTVGSQ
jgi:hypothetical protein